MISKVKQMSSKKRMLVIMGGIVFILFCALNVFWYITVYHKYSDYTDAVPKNEYGIYGLTDSEGYNYNVKKPRYLSFKSGNLGVSTNDGNGLIIWPKPFGEYKYGALITVDDISYQIYITEELEVVDNDNETYKNILEKNKIIIEKLFEKANEKWDLSHD